MNVFIGYLHGKYFLCLHINCYTCIFKYPFLFFICHFSLIHCPLLITLIPVLSIAMTMYSSLNCLFLLSTSFIFISSRLTLLLIVVSSGIEDTFPLEWACVIPSVCLYGR